MPRYTKEDEKYIVSVIEVTKHMGLTTLPRGTNEALFQHFNKKFTRFSLQQKVSKLRSLIMKGSPVPKYSLEESVKLYNDREFMSKPAIKPFLESANQDDDILPEIPNGIGRLCRLSREIERLSAEFGKAVKEFREEYDDNMDMLRKMGELRRAAENVSRKIVKGE